MTIARARTKRVEDVPLRLVCCGKVRDSLAMNAGRDILVVLGSGHPYRYECDCGVTTTGQRLQLAEPMGHWTSVVVEAIDIDEGRP